MLIYMLLERGRCSEAYSDELCKFCEDLGKFNTESFHHEGRLRVP